MDEQKPNWSSPKVVLIVHDQFCQIQLRLNYYYEKERKMIQIYITNRKCKATSTQYQNQRKFEHQYFQKHKR